MMQRTRRLFVYCFLSILGSCLFADAQDSLIWKAGQQWEFETAYVQKYLFRGTDVLNDDPAWQSHVETVIPNILDPGDLTLGIWSSFAIDGGSNDEYDELRYYLGLDNVSSDRKLKFLANWTYYDRKGDSDFFQDQDDLDFLETSIGVQLLKVPFQPLVRIHYDYPVSEDDGPEKGFFFELTSEYQQPLGKIGQPLGLSCLNLSATGWYQDGVFGYEPGASATCSAETPVEFWGLEFRPGMHYSHVFDDPRDSGVTDDDDEWWFTAALTYRFGHKPSEAMPSNGPTGSAFDLLPGFSNGE